MSPHQTALRYAIEDVLNLAEKLNHHKLPIKEHEYVIETLTSFVSDAAIKFVLGSIEHCTEPFLGSSRNHRLEAKKEIIDLLYYINAIK